MIILVPVYGSGDDAGNYTEVWLDDGQILLDRRRTKNVLMSWGRRWSWYLYACAGPAAAMKAAQAMWSAAR
ncbi:hypothetical protein [Neomoorella glycerini]|uniref:hypothetical protein n=1 Tax=Neomoorella glycerini TaxID=55779 RepID=UPI001479151A|nr:hypothetical protein [Moorella glycerini]